ncbi:MAG: protease complex subunit PrcB family protein [Candidatus Aenigmarchaeota archaeon]|nr:protease complex subunit PrcB family protein [Candidatus Aenigmarchaeota archaeon]
MQRHIILGIIALMILASGCTEQETLSVAAADIGIPFQIGVNQQAFLETENLGIELLNLVDDSRCPTDFRCAVSGEVVAEIMISKGTEILGVYNISDWRQSIGHTSKITVDKYVVELAGVSPYPKDNSGIRLSDYVLTFIVSKAVAQVPITKYEKDISFETIRTGIYSNQYEKKNHVIDNLVEWDTFWWSMDTTQSLPGINFSENLVLAVFQGEHSSGGHSISVNKIIETESALEVFLKEVSPGQRCSVTQALTQPYTIAVVEKTGKDVQFTTEQEITDC